MKRSKRFYKVFNSTKKPIIFKLTGKSWMCKSETCGIVEPTWQEAYETWRKLNG